MRQPHKNPLNLADALAACVEPRAEVGIREVIDLLLANGYKTDAMCFSVMVCNTLTRDPRWRRVGRGRYRRVQPS